MDERGKIEIFERVAAAWNQGDLEAITALMTEDHEWDLRRSGILGLSEVHFGHVGYLRSVESWRDLLGPGQVKILEAKELPDGRLWVLSEQLGTGAGSGADVGMRLVQILSFVGGKIARAELFTDVNEAREVAGLSPPDRVGGGTE